MMNAKAPRAHQTKAASTSRKDDTSNASSQTSPNGGVRRDPENEKQKSQAGWVEASGKVRHDPTAVPLPGEPIVTGVAAKTGTNTIHNPAVEWRKVYQELSDIRAQLDQLSGGNVIDQQGAIGCIAQIAGGDIETITNYFNENNLNITLNQWNDFSPAVESIHSELLRAQTAQILPWEIAQQTQAWLDFALEQAYDLPNNTTAFQSALDGARQSLESYATQVADNVKTEFAAANQPTRFQGFRAKHTRQARGWLGIFVGIAKLILAIEFVSKLVPLLALL